MANNVYNPPIPYVGPVPGPAAPGFTIHIRGSSHPSCNRFAINLQCGPNISPRDDVLLHIGVDFLRGTVVRNSIHGMNWGPEEIQQSYFPLNRGAPFEIVIRCESTHYNIAINGQQFATFEHRIVYHRASHIAVDGDIIVASIEYNSVNHCSPHLGGGMYPQPHMPGYNPSSTPYPVSPSVPLAHQSHPGSMYGPAMVGAAAMHGGPNPHAPHLSSPYVGSHGQQKHGVVDGLLKKIGVGGAGAASTGALAATAGLGYLGSKKAWKAQKKTRKKALKYGIPLAGAGLGAYAISRAFHSGSSSSSSSSSDEE